MKLSIIIFLVSLISFHTVAQRADANEVFMFSYFRNNGEDGLHLAYSEDGYTWQVLKHDSSFLKPTVGNDKLMRDPCIIKGPDGTFHMVWTASWKENGIGYAHSTDLIHWSAQDYIPVMAHEPGARNCWAPEIFYDQENKLFMIYWSTTITGRFPETESKKENAYNHRVYFVTTKDFATFSETKLLYEPGFNVIDATLIKEGKEFVLFLKDETIEPPQKNIRMARSTSMTEGYGKPSPPVTGNYWAEGPTATKLGKQWIVYFDKYRDKKMGAVVSTDLVQWTDISDKISFPQGTRHGTVFKISKEEFRKLLK